MRYRRNSIMSSSRTLPAAKAGVSSASSRAGRQRPPGDWLGQPETEWVAVVQGQARLRFENEATAREMRAGDWVAIPGGIRHRVEWTTPDEPTVWLALHVADRRGA